MQPINMIKIYNWNKKITVSWYEFMPDFDSMWVQERGSGISVLAARQDDDDDDNGAHERPSSCELLRRDVFGLRQNLSWHRHYQGIVQPILVGSQLPARSGIFCPLVEVVYCLCGLIFVYLTINLVFLEIVVKVKLLVKFCLHSFKWFCSQINSDAKYFSSLVQGIVIED